MAGPLRITVWNEFRHEKESRDVRDVYPEGIHATLAAALTEQLGDKATVTTATLDQTHHGLPEERIAATDVMFWWGHKAHGEVTDAVADAVVKRVREGMGLVVLHSGHYSKVFTRLMGTGCGLKWRDVGERERLWIVDPGHEIAEGLGESFDIEREEMYSEFFDIPQPDELVMVSWFKGGNVFRSCCTWKRGKGRVVYFRPGHEMFPTYHLPVVRKVLGNMARWAAPRVGSPYSLESPYEYPRPAESASEPRP